MAKSHKDVFGSNYIKENPEEQVIFPFKYKCIHIIMHMHIINTTQTH